MMDIQQTTFIGVDPTSCNKAFRFASLNHDLKMLTLEEGELDEVVAFISGQPSAYVAVNAPSGLNIGLVKDDETRQTLPSLRRASRGKDMRLVEHTLRERGIYVATTPSTGELCPAWVQSGFACYESLKKLGYQRYPHAESPYQYLETHAQAAFIALLGQMPFSKAALEGQLQRQLVLHESGISISDPMDFFEEITRHKLLKGILPVGILYHGGELDALITAYVAYKAAMHPDEVVLLGDVAEGQVVLPVKELKERY
jgi:hypothetical protein